MEGLTTFEVSKIIGLAVRSIQLMVDRGELKASITSGGHRRIAIDSLIDWLNIHRGPHSLIMRGIAPAKRGRPSKSQLGLDLGEYQNSRKVRSGSSSFDALWIFNNLKETNPTRSSIREQVVGVNIFNESSGLHGLLRMHKLKPKLVIVDSDLNDLLGITVVNTIRLNISEKPDHIAIVTDKDSDSIILKNLPADIHKTDFKNLPNLIHKIATLNRYSIHKANAERLAF